ncbi:hypothetical protein LTR10_015110 [Elasticomyces elasticus]|uniref:Uncharacterized protein n=1 Tax=Exophiala sideris TaxID=1016849 RepID=A0ABR0JQX6_9EURO|nr:hypothetical protein LTR10_015110 [Elasticomyces elasticus]KAK5034692.1 hypothetical protein LTR13_006348 [Exophiala sideris]KAK5039986.1 hypothetical protein LTS07_000481 [Exophiala sideris]KAK5068364.1 hypothetical protein LTR69_000482 [Exophiala sideris]KAK5187666.1 hypothetical protein LTR44_000482 [Eurotiomycetes sp. CCFEE 6388]
MSVEIAENIPQSNATISRALQQIGYLPVQTVDRSSMSDRLGPWPLKRNGSSCSTVVASSSSDSTGSSGEQTRVASPDDEDPKCGRDRRKSELTETLEIVDRQCEFIKKLLEGEEATLRSHVEETGRLERQLRDEQQQRQEVVAQVQQDVESGAAAQRGQQRCQKCDRSAEEVARAVRIGVTVLFISMLAVIFSPYILWHSFGRKHAWDDLTALQRKRYLYTILVVPALSYTFAIAVSWWSMLVIKRISRERKSGWSLSFGLVSWTVVFYFWCSFWLLPMVK